MLGTFPLQSESLLPEESVKTQMKPEEKRLREKKKGKGPPGIIIIAQIK